MMRQKTKGETADENRGHLKSENTTMLGLLNLAEDIFIAGITPAMEWQFHGRCGSFSCLKRHIKQGLKATGQHGAKVLGGQGISWMKVEDCAANLLFSVENKSIEDLPTGATTRQSRY
jgi:hypothetical protein